MARTRTRKTAAAEPAPTSGRRRRRSAAVEETDVAAAEGNGEGPKKGNAEALAKAREAKREERESMEAHQLEVLLERFGEHPAVPDADEGDESMGVVAKDLNITPGKAAFILMKHAVAEKKVPAITAKDDDDLVDAINDARLEAGPYSSWGWLAARSGKPESWIKAELGEAGLYTPKAENIATKRAEANKPEPEPEPEAEAPKTTGRRRRRGNAS